MLSALPLFLRGGERRELPLAAAAAGRVLAFGVLAGYGLGWALLLFSTQLGLLGQCRCARGPTESPNRDMGIPLGPV